VTQTDLLAILSRFRVQGEETLRPDHVQLVEEAPSPGFVVLSVQGASNLPKVGEGSSRNPYVVVKKGEVTTLRTEAVACSQDPVYLCPAIVMEIDAENLLSLDPLLTFEVWDENHGHADTLIATMALPPSALRRTHGPLRATCHQLEPQVSYIPIRLRI
jgi:hypothetical protein